MSISHVAETSNGGTGLATLTITPTSVGNVVFLAVLVSAGNAVDTPVTRLVASNIQWDAFPVAALPLAGGAGRTELWKGVATSTSAAATTLLWGTIPTTFTVLIADEFSKTDTGAWYVFAPGGQNNTGSSTNMSFPTLKSPASGNTAGYFGVMNPQSFNGTGGTGTGFTFTEPQLNVACYNTALATSTSFTPVGTQSPASTSFGVACIFTSGAPAFKGAYGSTVLDPFANQLSGLWTQLGWNDSSGIGEATDNVSAWGLAANNGLDCAAAWNSQIAMQQGQVIEVFGDMAAQDTTGPWLLGWMSGLPWDNILWPSGYALLYWLGGGAGNFELSRLDETPVSQKTILANSTVTYAAGTWIELAIRSDGIIEAWTSSDGLNWTKQFSAADGTYMWSNFKMGLEIAGGSTAKIKNFGGGIQTLPPGSVQPGFSQFPKQILER